MIKNEPNQLFIDRIFKKYHEMPCIQYQELLNQYQYIMQFISTDKQPDRYFSIVFENDSLTFNWYQYQDSIQKDEPIFKEIMFNTTKELLHKSDVLYQMKFIHVSYLIKEIYPDLIHNSNMLMKLTNCVDDLLIFKGIMLELIRSLQKKYYENMIKKNINQIHHNDLSFEQQAVFLVNHIRQLSGASFSNKWTSSSYSVEDEVGYFYYKRFENVTAIKFKEIISKYIVNEPFLFRKEYHLDDSLKSGDESYRRWKNDLRSYKKQGLLK